MGVGWGVGHFIGLQRVPSRMEDVVTGRPGMAAAAGSWLVVFHSPGKWHEQELGPGYKISQPTYS